MFLDAFDGLFLIQRGLDGDMVSVVKASFRLEFETGVKITDFSIILGINYHSTLVCSWKLFWPTHCKAMSLRQTLRRYFFIHSLSHSWVVFLVAQDSFQTLKKWVKELKEHGPEDIVVAIAGNKNDLGDIRWASLSVKTQIWRWWWWYKAPPPTRSVLCVHWKTISHETEHNWTSSHPVVFRTIRTFNSGTWSSNNRQQCGGMW